MDDETTTSTVTKAVLVVAGIALLALPAREAFGHRGLEVVLLLGLVVVGALAWSELTGRPLSWPRRGRTADVPAAPEPDEWRSERWVREAVERGLRSLDEWRMEQREA